VNRHAHTLRTHSSNAEKLLWRHLRNRQVEGVKFRRQDPIGPYIADFVCLSAKLIIELDGGQHAVRSEHDEKRTRYLESLGYRVLRYWNNDVLTNIDGVLQDIRAKLLSPHPAPLPEGEGTIHEAAVRLPLPPGDECMDARGRAAQGAAAEGRGEEVIPPVTPTELRVRHLGLRDYQPVWRAMQQFTQRRDAATPDELWLVEHASVYTQGLSGKPEHVLAPGAIPVVQTDRGGQVTYHGPGQLVAYTLIDLARRQLGVRELVSALEQTVIALLAEHGIAAQARRDAPGVYVNGAKIASLGLRVRRGRSYHGLSLNVAMDLEPFARINPCGYAGLAVTQLATLGGPDNLADAAEGLIRHFATRLGYNSAHITNADFPL
jgi:lipoyl(octanoyl) transferase